LRANSIARRACPRVIRVRARTADAALANPSPCHANDRSNPPIARSRKKSTRSANRHIPLDIEIGHLRVDLLDRTLELGQDIEHTPILKTG